MPMNADLSAAAPAILEAQGLRLAYPGAGGSDHVVLQDFSLRLEAGEVIALLGPSGVGKSSVLRVLAGLQQADRGHVQFHGQPLTGPHPRSSFVFQDPCLLPWLTLEENVAFGLDFRHQPQLAAEEARARVRTAIEEVGLHGANGRYPAELSGGMAQRASLARSLARQPEMLLLDEPFSALDEITRGDMQVLLKNITASHATAAVLVTHDIDEALVLADRILLIAGAPGRLAGEWVLTEDHPRDPLAPELGAIRLEIMRLLREHRRATTPTSQNPHTPIAAAA